MYGSIRRGPVQSVMNSCSPSRVVNHVRQDGLRHLEQYCIHAACKSGLHHAVLGRRTSLPSLFPHALLLHDLFSVLQIPGRAGILSPGHSAQRTVDVESEHTPVLSRVTHTDVCQDPAFNASRDERVRLAQQSIDFSVMAHNISTTLGYGTTGFDSWESAHILGGVAMADYAAGTRMWEQGLTQVFPPVMAGLGHGSV
jgi:hypothetical protein